MATVARGTGASAYNFVQGSDIFVHLLKLFIQESTTVKKYLEKDTEEFEYS